MALRAQTAISLVKDATRAIPPSQWRTVDDLVQEYRTGSSDDSWGDCMAAWLAVAIELDIRGEQVPDEWYYRPGAGGSHHEQGDWWGEIVQGSTTEALQAFGAKLHRLSGLLKAAGKDY